MLCSECGADMKLDRIGALNKCWARYHSQWNILIGKWDSYRVVIGQRKDLYKIAIKLLTREKYQNYLCPPPWNYRSTWWWNSLKGTWGMKRVSHVAENTLGLLNVMHACTMVGRVILIETLVTNKQASAWFRRTRWRTLIDACIIIMKAVSLFMRFCLRRSTFLHCGFHLQGIDIWYAEEEVKQNN